jgi:hypothetical protein
MAAESNPFAGTATWLRAPYAYTKASANPFWT